MHFCSDFNKTHMQIFNNKCVSIAYYSVYNTSGLML